MKKYTLLAILLFLVVGKINAQKIGVNTVLPLSDLHIHGKLQVTKDFNFGGTATSKGDSGEEGQVLKSNGEGKAPEWSTLTIPIVPPGSYAMTNTTVIVDHKGAQLEEEVGRRTYVKNEPIDTIPINDPKAKWIKLEELDSNLLITQDKNKVNLTLQTIASISQKGSSTNKTPIFTYAIGFFVDKKLKAVKTFKVEGKKDAFEVTTVITTLLNLKKGNHLLEVAVIPRKKDGFTGVLAIGRPNKDDEDLISAFMAQTSLKIDVFEVLN
ncbi:hypothetical protein [Myroides odoratimimus]|uniref:hypothetical protein n=1 Tax=Myroides odoratimimus TaxID=76832 RepID=UPI002574C258|nr:hypothetical protein [Myroides odoratimimus]MDM1529775.1 hypothetical protein [Myroides odoratimimus]